MPRKMPTKREIKEELEFLRAKFLATRCHGSRLSDKDDTCLRMAIDVLSWAVGEHDVMSPSELVDPGE